MSDTPTPWQASVLDLYDRVGEVVVRTHGYDPFVMYGSLLGLVRDGAFIGHDIDFDTAYISKFTTGPDARAELHDIGFTLIDAGFNIVCRDTSLHVHDKLDPSIRMDLFHLYFDDADGHRLAFPYGYAGTSEFTATDWSGLVDAQLVGHAVKAPAAAEALLERIYGPTWRTPDPDFQWAQARRGQAEAGVLTAGEIEEVYWSNFYARTELTTGSSFFDAVVARDDTPPTVLDIGCGDGRDTFAFAHAGKTALGLDRSHIGIRHATKKADNAGIGDRLSFVTGDVSDADAVQDLLAHARAAADGQPLLYYMRFFLHSIPEPVQETLLSAIAEAAEDGDMLAAEFRTEKDEPNQKTFGKEHYRRYQSGAAFEHTLVHRFGFTVLHSEEGTGLSPYKDEDPVLYRVIATRGDVSDH